jgi:TolB-like protein/Flp pilus assembly protein TadD
VLTNEGRREEIGSGPTEPVAAPTEIASVACPRPLEPLVGFLKRRIRAALLGVLAAALGVGAIYFWRARTTTTAPVQPIRTIAVLPFKPLVQESRDEDLELGIADTLIAKLSNSREFVVRPISSGRRYGGVEQDPATAGRELGVEAVLDGTIQRSGDRVRVTARLTRVGDGGSLWAGQFDEKFTDIFAMQDSVSLRVAESLRPSLTGEERALLAKRYIDNAEAYNLYLKGRLFWNRRMREGDERAAGYFRQALARDPTYALAHAGISDYYRALPIAHEVASRDALPKAKAAARRALEIDEGLAEAHSALGWVNFFECDLEGAVKEHRRALEINPNLPDARLGYAQALSNLNRHEEALVEVERALKLEPLSLHIGSLKGHFLFHARPYPEAIEHLRKTLEIEPKFWIGQIALGKSYERLGRYAEALGAFRKAEEFRGRTSQIVALSGFTHAVSGQREEAERALRELLAASGQGYVPPYHVALVHHGLGNADEALRWLERAHQESDVHMVYLGVDPKWDTLRNDPRFVGLLERMKLRR